MEWSFKPNNQVETHLVQVSAAQTDTAEEFLSKYSDLPRALRVMSYIFRFYYSLYSKKRWAQFPLSHALNQSEFRLAMDRLIILCQSTHFSQYSYLKNGSTLIP